MICGGFRINHKKQLKSNELIITVITVVYNACDTIKKTIESVLCQKYDNIEYIILDGGSTDGTIDIIKQYDDKIAYWQSEPDNGIYDAMNKGIALSTGDYINLLNAGDWYDCDTLEIILQSINAHPDYDVYYGMARMLKYGKNCLWIYGSSIDYINVMMICHPSCFVSTTVYKNNLFDLKYKSAADYDLFIRLYKLGYKFYFIEKVYINFATGGMSDSAYGQLESFSIKHKYGFLEGWQYFIRVAYYTFLKLLHK